MDMLNLKMEHIIFLCFCRALQAVTCNYLLESIIPVLLQLENYAKTEEAKVEELIKAVADSGAKVIVSGAAVGDMALHFCERYK
jgi:hypothetical protein